MKKLIFFLLFSWFGFIQFESTFAQRHEVIGRITSSQFVALPDSEITIVVGEKKIIVDGSCILAVKFIPSPRNSSKPDIGTRVRIFYKEIDGVNVATKIISEKITSSSLRLVFPIPQNLPPTAISSGGSKKDLGKITSFGWGLASEVRVYKGFRIFMDLTNFKYKQVLANQGEKVTTLDNGFKPITLGAKYISESSPIRLGVKYVFLRQTSVQPWIGFSYGLTLWNISYTTFDEQRIYGKANGSSFGSSFMCGIDFKKLATISLFFETFSSSATYSMDLPAFYGHYETSNGLTIPSPRIGLLIGGL